VLVDVAAVACGAATHNVRLPSIPPPPPPAQTQQPFCHRSDRCCTGSHARQPKPRPGSTSPPCRCCISCPTTVQASSAQPVPSPPASAANSSPACSSAAFCVAAAPPYATTTTLMPFLHRFGSNSSDAGPPCRLRFVAVYLLCHPDQHASACPMFCSLAACVASRRAEAPAASFCGMRHALFLCRFSSASCPQEPHQAPPRPSLSSLSLKQQFSTDRPPPPPPPSPLRVTATQSTSYSSDSKVQPSTF
jgi:hypothetical protein